MASPEDAEALLFTLPIWDSARHDGEGKSQNQPTTQIERTDITNRNNALFHIDISMVTCVHGVLGNGDSTPASFIVFHCEINSLQEYYVRKVKIEWEFINDDGESPPSNPSVVARGPTLVRRYNPSNVEHHDEAEIEAGFEAEAPVKSGVKLHLTKAKDYKRQYFEKARSGVVHASQKDHRYTKVWWIYEQNQEQHQGISPGFRIAVLLRRQNNSSFKGLFSLAEFDAGWMYKAALAWKDFFGAKEPPNVDDPVNFNPSSQQIGGKDIDKDALGALKTDAGISREHAWIWGVDLE